MFIYFIIYLESKVPKIPIIITIPRLNILISQANHFLNTAQKQHPGLPNDN